MSQPEMTDILAYADEQSLAREDERELELERKWRGWGWGTGTRDEFWRLARPGWVWDDWSI